MSIETLISTLVGVIIGALSATVPLYVYRQTDKRLEADEIRKRKVGIVLQLLGSRYVLNPEYAASSEEAMVFNTAMALFTVYFSNDRDVMKAYDSFLHSKTDANLVSLLRIAAKSADLDPLDSTLSRVVTVKASIGPIIVPMQTGKAEK